MFLADDVILFPFKSILKVFQEIYKAAIEDIRSEADSIRNELSQLYLALESGAVTEDAFDAREAELLDRLDVIEERGVLETDDQGDDDNDQDDQDDGDGDGDDSQDDEDDDGCDYVYENSSDAEDWPSTSDEQGRNSP